MLQEPRLECRNRHDDGGGLGEQDPRQVFENRDQAEAFHRDVTGLSNRRGPDRETPVVLPERSQVEPSGALL